MHFYYTTNGKFLITSLEKSRYCLFKKIFNDHYEYLKENENSLIDRYGVKHNEHTICCIVMESIF